MIKTRLSEPPSLNTEEGEAKSCVVFNNGEFTSFFNRFAWFDFRLSLWHMATSLSPGEDVGIYSDNCTLVLDGFVIVPYCEITLIPGDQPAGRFLKVKRNYLYRPEDRRVDFSVVRSEAEAAFLASGSLKAGQEKVKLFDNLWIQILDDL
jgi:hypothetical protein